MKLIAVKLLNMKLYLIKENKYYVFNVKKVNKEENMK